MALLLYDDVPGVIGRIGTLFGDAGVNIANMAVSRTREGGKALMALSLDSPVPDELVRRAARDERHRLRRAVEWPGWPEPVERVAEVLALGRRRGAHRGAAARHADRARRGRRARLRARRRSSSRSSWSATAPTSSRSSRATGAPTRQGSQAPWARRPPGSRGPTRSSRRPASSPAAWRRSRTASSREVLLDRSLLGQAAVWIGAGTPDHMAVLTSADLQRLAKARLVDLDSSAG